MIFVRVPTSEVKLHSSQEMKASTQKPILPRRRVQICESNNVYHDSEEAGVDPSQWYSLEDYRAFTFEARRTADKLQASRDPNSWSNSLMRVYFTIRVAKTPQEVKKVVDVTDISLDETNLGLQDHCLYPICSDYVIRRRHLMEQISRLQNSSHPSDSQRESLIEQTSLLSSHASRMYAYIVAQAII